MMVSKEFNIFGCKKFPRLPECEIRSLICQIQECNDRNSFKQLILANSGFIVRTAQKYQNRGLSMGDLIDETIIGMYRAAKKFDPSQPVKFISYAIWWMRESIQRALINEHMIPIHGRQLNLIRKVNKFLDTGKRYSEILELPEFEGAKKEIDELLQITTVISLSMDDESDEYICDVAGDTPNHTHKMESDDIFQCISRLKILTSAEEDILRRLYGIGYNSECTLEQVGKKYNLSKERIRQIRNSALRKLRISLTMNPLDI